MDVQRLKRVVTSRWSRARVAGLAYRYGLWRVTLWLSPGEGLPERMRRAVAIKNLGDAVAAEALIDDALRELPSARSFHLLMNSALDALIALGRYRDALGLEAAIGPRRDWQWALAQSNLAEAEYCQGQLQAAARRLSQPGLDGAAALALMARSGVALQRAWLAVQQGDVEKALASVATVSPADCPRSYRAEWYFTSAAAHGLAGHASEADDALEAGARIALRCSSVRNALALRGMLLRARGKPREAEHWLSRAATHRWQRQSGSLLLAWGDVLDDLNRPTDARAAWKRAIEQDPESEAAAQAATR